MLKKKFDNILIPQCDNVVIRHEIGFFDLQYRFSLYQISVIVWITIS
jgi:hypothetical protein